MSSPRSSFTRARIPPPSPIFSVGVDENAHDASASEASASDLFAHAVKLAEPASFLHFEIFVLLGEIELAKDAALAYSAKGGRGKDDSEECSLYVKKLTEELKTKLDELGEMPSEDCAFDRRHPLFPAFCKRRDLAQAHI